VNKELIKDAIRDQLKRSPTGNSFVDLMNACRKVGIDPEGDVGLKLKENLYVWAGVSDDFSDAYRELWDGHEIKGCPTTAMIYYIDGQTLTLPVAKKYRPYKKPHWYPIAIAACTKADEAQRLKAAAQ
jgi:hypothetical protein